MAAAAARVVMAGIVTVANVWAAGGDTQPAMRCQQRRDHPPNFHLLSILQFCFPSFILKALPRSGI